MSFKNGIVSAKIYDKQDNFNFEIVHVPFLDGDVPRSLPIMYTFRNLFVSLQYKYVDDFNNRNTFLTSKLLKQGYRYHRLQKAFSKLYYRHSELIIKYKHGKLRGNTSCTTRLKFGLTFSDIVKVY